MSADHFESDHPAREGDDRHARGAAANPIHHHGQSHGGHGHSHAPASFGLAFAVGISLNMIFVLVEAGYGFWANSVALLADAGHNFSDVLGLVIAWLGATLAKRSPSDRYTYGLKGSSILAALANGVLLLVAIGAILLEAAQRIVDPQPVNGLGVMVVAGIGIVVNGVTALLFARGRKGDLNIRGAYLHMAADAAVSAGVVVAGGLILLTGQLWLDPVASIAIALVVLWGTYGLLRESIAMSLLGVPADVELQRVEEELLRLPGVALVHDLHVWNLGTTDKALTAHLYMPGTPPGDDFLHRAADRMAERFGIGHSTFQVETSDPSDCRLHDDESG